MKFFSSTSLATCFVAFGALSAQAGPWAPPKGMEWEKKCTAPADQNIVSHPCVFRSTADHDKRATAYFRVCEAGLESIPFLLVDTEVGSVPTLIIDDDTSFPAKYANPITDILLLTEIVENVRGRCNEGLAVDVTQILLKAAPPCGLFCYNTKYEKNYVL